MGIWGIVATVIGSMGIGGIIMHLLKRSQYRAQTAADWQKVYNDTVDFINRQLEAERKMCDVKIEALHKEVEALNKEMQIVKNRCKNNCFEDAA